MNDKTILLVDDDDVLRQRLERSLQRRGYAVWCAANYDEALQRVADGAPHMAVIDLKMPGRSGMELLVELRRRCPQTRCVILTGYGSIANAVEAVKLGAINYVTKPVDADEVLAALRATAKPTAPAAAEELPTPSLAEAEWQHIQRVLADCGGNISEAARRLEIPRRTLQRKLKKMAP